jgi:hypothetical protein
MLAAIEFYDELQLVAVEIGEVHPQRLLASDFHSRQLPVAQATP